MIEHHNIEVASGDGYVSVFLGVIKREQGDWVWGSTYSPWIITTQRNAMRGWSAEARRGRKRFRGRGDDELAAVGQAIAAASEWTSAQFASRGIRHWSPMKKEVRA